MLVRSTARKISLILIFVSCSYSIIRSAIFVHNYYLGPIYWDQWEFVKDIKENGSNIFSLDYIFLAHNEHIIATTKFFFILDYLFFKLTNGPLVALIFFLAFIIAGSISLLVFTGRVKGVLCFALCFVLFASGVSLAQHENLLWGFQPQFYLVSLTAVWGVFAALKLVESPARSRQLFWFVALCLFTFLSIFSMGNGIALPVSIGLFLVFVRWRHWPMLAGYLTISALFICIDLYLTRHSLPVGGLGQRAPSDVLLFFFAMIGGALTGSLDTAYKIGIGIFLIYGFTFIKLIAAPWSKRQDIDRGVAALVALASFFFAAALATAWTRSPLGSGAALSSRYSTPMLLLIMTWVCIWLREILVRKDDKNFGLIAILMVMVAIVGTSTMSEENAIHFSKAQTRAAYFALSHVDSDEQLLKLYPDAKAIRAELNWLRQNNLNIFARNGGIDTPTITELLSVQNLGNDRICRDYAIESIMQTSSGQLQLVGWITDAQKHTPVWVLAFDGQGNLLGFTKPLEDRPDITAAVGAEAGFRGVILPVNMNSSERRNVELRVISTDRDKSCKIANLKMTG
ncbi:hypothetical protein HWD97_13940 [Ochrobactrum sp. C6C9]|uniref:hypothetical protein n=1 Tax=Ochrobactrum sp. C6C9 TaxID=2736662 RepID=UPI0035301E70|nr:hypothetical protein [Ochrobactrum sp. C6C9]